MAVLNRNLSYGEVIGLGIRVYSQGGRHFDASGREVKVLPDVPIDDMPTYRLELVEPTPEEMPIRPNVYQDKPGPAAAPLSFKGVYGVPGTLEPEVRSWAMLHDEALTRVVESYGEKFTTREAAIEFLEAEGIVKNGLEPGDK